SADPSRLRACECVPHLLLGRVVVDEGEIRTDGLMEDMTVLGDDADGLAQIGKRQIPDIDSADADRTAGDIVEARQQRGDRRFPCPRGADEGEGVAGGDRQAKVIDYLLLDAGMV